jgi:enoyl-CoA hydratase
MDVSKGTKVRYAIDQGIMRIKLDDGKANAIERQFLADLHEALDAAERDAGGVLIEGREGRFCAGFDLRAVPAMDPETLRGFFLDFTRTMARIFVFPRPVVCAIGGHAIAGGAILALTADRRIMAGGPLQIGLREVAIGIPLPVFGCELAQAVLPRSSLVGAVLCGELYTPEQALSCGMVDRVVPPDELVEAGMAMARAMAAVPREAFAATKLVLRKEHQARIAAAEQSDGELLTNVFLSRAAEIRGLATAKPAG